MYVIKTIEWKNDTVVMLDQRKLPRQEVYNTYGDYKGVADAIRTMVIRGAPAIGVAAAMGVALGALGIGVNNFEGFMERLERVCETLLTTRPTAVNLAWAVERMRRVCHDHRDMTIQALKERLREEALTIYHEDIEVNRMIGKHGQTLLADGDAVLTHCNAGALATAGFGTALGVLYAAQEAGKRLRIYADETRPFLQGARLTAWELQKHGMDVTVITDNMAGALMAQGKIHQVIVGADRIAANGDVANKIGTYSVAVLAHHHRLPMYVAAPCSTIDFAKGSGAEIPIEERPAGEVTAIEGVPITPALVKVVNPSFDVTPADLVSAIITERGWNSALTTLAGRSATGVFRI
ncbi:MAG: S-methyl-5-thioribose-1-phosphate isomerase [Deltaproteobacteria bacterium]|nr:S-methyl-5-thioribose-1-phosphate isomerase [Deltaproteobacteria bacterium]